MAASYDNSPAFQFYPKDFLTSERQLGMSAAEAGIYMRLICHCWLSVTLPNVPRILSKMAGVSEDEFASSWPVVQECFYINPQGRLQHARLDKERLKQQEFRRRQSDKGKKGADKRWPRLSPGDSTGNTEGMPGDSSSSPISDLRSSSSSPISDLQSPSPSLIRTNSRIRSSGVPITSKPAAATNGHAPANGNGHTNGRSKRPIFTGQRLTVFDWMLDDCAQTLGPLTDAFDLHSWFFDLDKRLASQNFVIPKRDGGKWLQSELLQEAQSRGLPIAVADSGPSARTVNNAMSIQRTIDRIRGAK